MSEIMEYVDTFTQDPVTKKYERVACYIRVSTQEQKLHGISLDAQRDKLKEYAKKHNLKIVEWYEDEGVSGRKLIKNRPELQRMLHDAKAKKFDRIIFIKLDRFFRSVAEYHECMKYIDPILWTATEEKYDLTTANGRAFVNMKLTIAELEADQTGERINLVNEYKIKNGQPLTGAKNQGLGFTVKTDENGIKRVVKDPETKDAVMDIINYFLTHQAKAQTCRYVKDKFNINMNIKGLDNFLNNTKLYGFYKGNPNYCEGYIDKATFDQLQLLCHKHVKSAPSKRVYLFSGLVKCPNCGNILAHSSNKNVKPVISLRCNHYSVYKKCDFNKRPNERKLENSIIDNFEYFIKDYIAEVNGISNNTPDSDEERINKRIKEIKKEMANSVKSFNKGRMTEAEHDREYDALEAELKQLEEKLEPVKERDLTLYEEVLKSDWKTIYNSLTKENKRAFIRKYIKEIKLNPDGTFNRVIFF